MHAGICIICTEYIYFWSICINLADTLIQRNHSKYVFLSVHTFPLRVDYSIQICVNHMSTIVQCVKACMVTIRPRLWFSIKNQTQFLHAQERLVFLSHYYWAVIVILFLHKIRAVHAVPCLVKSEIVQKYLSFLSLPRRDVKYAWRA